MRKFIELTRVYKKKGATEVSEGSVTVALGDIAAYRASNRLGFPEHRSTLTLGSGVELELSDKYTAIKAAIAAVNR